MHAHVRRLCVWLMRVAVCFWRSELEVGARMNAPEDGVGCCQSDKPNI